MKNKCLLLLTIIFVFLLVTTVEAKPVSPGKKILVVYFSHTGNTREIANQIHSIVGGDIVEIKTVKPYPRDYSTVVDQAKKELKNGYNPPLKTKVKNIRSYDIIFVGYPNWWGTMPRAVFTFLSQYDFSGKTIIPFCTHGGGGIGRSIDEIKKLCPKSKLLEGFETPGSNVKSAKNEVYQWLKKIKIAK